MADNITAVLGIPEAVAQSGPPWLLIYAGVTLLIGLAFIIFAGVKYWRRVTSWFQERVKSIDGKPTTIAFFFQRDQCSRLFVEFGETKLNDCAKLVVIRETRDGAVDMVSTEDETGTECLIYKANRMVVAK